MQQIEKTMKSMNDPEIMINELKQKLNEKMAQFLKSIFEERYNFT